ncbi:MAG TPA: adenylate/guanylate cyclase domain-containing protein [Candidatus Acidoferrum sp.]|nr:adenylate/guanylate cyclase domain-containing protein [Candidatus Acidoferrum sp.]
MPTPPEGVRSARHAFRFRELFSFWWEHRASFFISVVITLAALGVYFFPFLGDRNTPLFDFLKRFEYSTLDTRFRYRPTRYTPPDPRIVVVAIDQRSQEVLGKWPFSRKYFGEMLDALREDGAKVVSFDITFDKPDQTVAPIRALWAKLEADKKAGKPPDPKLEAQVFELAREFDADAQFAAALGRFGPVVLGNFYLMPQEIQGIDDATLDKYAAMVQWYALNRNAINPATGKADFASLLNSYQFEGTLYSATIANIPELAPPDNDEKTAIGFFNISSDADGVLRRALLVLPFGRTGNPDDFDLYGSLEVQTLRLYLGLKTEQVTVNYGPAGISTLQFGDKLTVHPDWLGRIIVNYRGPANTYPYHSIADVVHRKFAPGTFKDKIVLVGASATGIGDLRTPPYGGISYPGLEVHANVIDNMLNNAFLIRGVHQQLLDLLLIFVFGIPLGIALALVSPRWMWFGLALLIPFAVLTYLAFLHGWWLNFTLPAGTLTANVMLVSLYRALVEEKEKRKVRSAFGQYLSPEVIRRLLLNPQLVEPRKTDITVMFSDIRGFTSISEKLDAQELALFLNGYLSDMTRIVFDTQGTLDKYIGDAVMAFWGAPYEDPGHAARACTAALTMMRRVHELQLQWEKEGKPKLDIGIGLNSGVASVGNMGSVLRYGYTALGDAVNLSSRLEGLNKEYGTHILANESTCSAAQDAGFLFRELDIIRVKGKLQPVTICELVGKLCELQQESAWAELQQCLARFAEARLLYHQRQWALAQQAFQAILDRWPDDGPSRMYWKRCQEYLFEEPPASWDGVFTMTHK